MRSDLSSSAPLETTRSPLLSVLIVNYNSWDTLGGLLAALSSSKAVVSGECEVVVVDNKSTEEPTAEDLRHFSQSVRLIMSGENGGFGAGINLAREHVRGEWLLVLNPDVLPGEDLPGQVLSRLAEYAHKGEEPPSISGFALRNSDGSPQPSVGLEPGLFQIVRGMFLPRPQRKYQSGSRVRPGPVSWVTGACMLVSAQAFDALGGMDEAFFLYYEEVDFCRRALQSGLRVEFDPTITVTHLKPLQNRRVAPEMRLITRHSLLTYSRKHHGRLHFQAIASVIIAESAVRQLWAWLFREGREAAAWGVVRQIAASVRRGEVVSGRRVRDFASKLGQGSGLPENPLTEMPISAILRQRPEERNVDIASCVSGSGREAMQSAQPLSAKRSSWLGCREPVSWMRD